MEEGNTHAIKEKKNNKRGREVREDIHPNTHTQTNDIKTKETKGEREEIDG